MSAGSNFILSGYGFGVGGFSFFERVFPVLFCAIFIIIIGFFIYTISTGVHEWNKNNSSPVLKVEAKIVSKRQSYSEFSGTEEHSTHSTSTWYYITFEVESGDRMEFSVSGKEYGLLAEGDYGKLTFQGTRYLGFVRQ